MQNAVKAKKRKSRIKNICAYTGAGLVTICVACGLLYYLFVFSGIPLFSFWRDIWIETAMTTMNHQWLATSFIPQDIIDEVMSRQNRNPDIVGGLYPAAVTAPETAVPDVPGPAADDTVPETQACTDDAGTGKTDILGQSDIVEGEPDYAGYKVLVNDVEQGIVISEIVGQGYRGRIMLVDDPSRVYVATTPYKNVEGMRILSMLDHYGAVAGINASGFPDPEGEGNGGKVVGQTVANGEYWGSYVNWTGSILLTQDNRLIVGNVRDWDAYNVRGGIQFGPVLIADGEIQVEGSAGWGIQPRTAIGQRADGAVALVVIDGRDLTYSVGCTVGELAKILHKYGVVNAACCDGGASSIMAYKGEVITRNSSANPTLGRRLPNAFLVAPKKPADS